MMKAQELIIRLHGSVHHTQREHNDHKISIACQLIGGANDIHYDIKEAAAAVNMRYVNFRKLFKATTGVSPQRYHIFTMIMRKQAPLPDSLRISSRDSPPKKLLTRWLTFFKPTPTRRRAWTAVRHPAQLEFQKSACFGSSFCCRF